MLLDSSDAIVLDLRGFVKHGRAQRTRSGWSQEKRRASSPSIQTITLLAQMAGLRLTSEKGRGPTARYRHARQTRTDGRATNCALERR
jgi:hypothetical protein